MNQTFTACILGTEPPLLPLINFPQRTTLLRATNEFNESFSSATSPVIRVSSSSSGSAMSGAIVASRLRGSMLLIWNYRELRCPSPWKPAQPKANWNLGRKIQYHRHANFAKPNSTLTTPRYPNTKKQAFHKRISCLSSCLTNSPSLSAKATVVPALYHWPSCRSSSRRRR